MIECFRNILPKRVSGSSGRYSPATAVIWVGPKQVTHRSFVGHFLDAVQRADVVEGVDTGRQASVETENLVINKCGKGKEIK